ncbi:type I polyketide synthase, partial [Streptomyces californicus]|uniref:type I polyketide synthase n=1 Tax=Streptomyces californicus TaxID=67351 RepID=UPI00369AD48F
FQRQSYWPQPGTAWAGDVAAVGLGAAEHPLLGAAVTLADAQTTLLTGRVSLRTHPWLADHAVADVILLPGAALLELAIRAGDQVGCGRVDELTLEAPLVVPETGSIALQVSVAAPDEEGRRALTVHSSGDDGRWTRHASGLLSVRADAAGFDLAQWPPSDAVRIDTDDLYDRLAVAGFQYGPLFQGLSSVWRRDGEIFADVALPDGEEATYGLHPALLDAALHALMAGDGSGGSGSAESTGGTRLPFSWEGVTLFASGATAARVRLAVDERGAVALQLADPAGQPVAAVEGLLTRPFNPGEIRAAGAVGTTRHDTLFRVDWTPVPVVAPASAAVEETWAVLGDDDFGLVREGVEQYADLDALVMSGAAPDRVLCSFGPGPDGAGSSTTAEAAASATARALALLQEWAEAPVPDGTTLVVLTRGAVATGADDLSDLVNSPVWGLVRTAQSEDPGRYVLADLDDRTDSHEALRTGLATALATEEPQLALREGTVLVPRLARAERDPGAEPADFGDGAVLLTGASGALGGVVARHLVAGHGVRHLVLISRRGARADGMAELEEELTSLGAEVTVAACDVADREALAELVDSIGAPVTGVVHSAGVLDDGVLSSLTPEKLDRVLRPKVHAAWNLHELTYRHAPSAFVLFSSAAATFGRPGQGNYAAANAFLDALAHHRRAAGLPAVAMAWGLWAERGGMTGELGDGDLSRMSRAGVTALTSQEGLALFDAAGAGGAGKAAGETLLLPMKLDTAAIAGAAGPVAPLLRGLVRVPARRRAVLDAPVPVTEPDAAGPAPESPFPVELRGAA